LENIKNRYQFFTEEKITVKDDERFTVQLPVIKNHVPEGKQRVRADRNLFTNDIK